MAMISTSMQQREWPGTGSGPKSDAYNLKFLSLHERQYDVHIDHRDMQPFLEAKGGIVVFSKHEGQRLVLFQGSWLSNFQPAIFRDQNGVAYNSTEQAFQALKALFVASEARTKGCDSVAASAMDVHQKIMQSTNPLYQKLSASARFLPMDQDMRERWDRVSPEAMLAAIRLKFGQNSHLRRRLLSLAGARILEAAADDAVWGIGMSAETAVRGAPPDLDTASPDPAKLDGWPGLAGMARDQMAAAAFPGQNRLGRILEHVRDELLAGRTAPLAGSEEWAREAAAGLLRRTQPAGDDENVCRGR